MQAGRLDRRVTFRRRAYISPRERGDFADYLSVWAQYTRASGREQMIAGQEVDFEPGTLRIRDSSEARAIQSSERVVIQGKDHRITSVSLPERRGGYIEIAVTTDLGET